MNFIGENPEEKYRLLMVNGLRVFIQQDDFVLDTVKQVIAFCEEHVFTDGGLFRSSALFYLRGTREKVGYELVLVGILEDFILPMQLFEVVHCLSFWNQEGRKMFALNGLRDESYRDFILKCIAADCRAFVEPWQALFITGKGQNHVWIGDQVSGERIFVIHFPEDEP